MGAGASQSKLPDVKLTKEQIERLQQKFSRLSKGHSTATISDLQRLPELAGNPMIPRIFQVFDSDGDDSLTLHEFIKAFEWFGTLKQPSDLYRLAFRSVGTAAVL